MTESAPSPSLPAPTDDAAFTPEEIRDRLCEGRTERTCACIVAAVRNPTAQPDALAALSLAFRDVETISSEDVPSGDHVTYALRMLAYGFDTMGMKDSTVYERRGGPIDATSYHELTAKQKAIVDFAVRHPEKCIGGSLDSGAFEDGERVASIISKSEQYDVTVSRAYPNTALGKYRDIAKARREQLAALDDLDDDADEVTVSFDRTVAEWFDFAGVATPDENIDIAPVMTRDDVLSALDVHIGGDVQSERTWAVSAVDGETNAPPDENDERQSDDESDESDDVSDDAGDAYECDECGETFENKTVYGNHVRWDHPETGDDDGDDENVTQTDLTGRPVDDEDADEVVTFDGETVDSVAALNDALDGLLERVRSLEGRADAIAESAVMPDEVPEPNDEAVEHLGERVDDLHERLDTVERRTASRLNAAENSIRSAHERVDGVDVVDDVDSESPADGRPAVDALDGFAMPVGTLERLAADDRYHANNVEIQRKFAGRKVVVEVIAARPDDSVLDDDSDANGDDDDD